MPMVFRGNKFVYLILDGPCPLLSLSFRQTVGMKKPFAPFSVNDL